MKYLLYASLVFTTTFATAEPKAALPEKHFTFLENYCLDCHDTDTQKGKIDLESLSFNLGSIESAEMWQKVLNTLNSGEMPPEKKEQPVPAEKETFLADLSQQLVIARKLLADTGGEITMRRLNRREYENTIEALLGVKIDVKDLPSDANAGGFDTAGGALFFSSDQFEQYLKLARTALDRAIVTGDKPQTKTVRIEAEEEANRRISGIFRGYHMGGYKKVKQLESDKTLKPSDVGIADQQEVDFRKRVWERDSPPFIDYLSRMETRDGALLTIGNPNPQVGLVIPDDMPPGKYAIRAKIGVMPRSAPENCFVEVGFRGERFDAAMELLDCFRVRAPHRKPEVIELKVDIPPLSKPLKIDIGSQTQKRIPIGERVIAFRQRSHNDRNAIVYQFFDSIKKTGFGPEPTLWIDWVEWEGPIVEHWPPASHTNLFFKGEAAKKDEAYAGAILEEFARRAFRIKEPEPSYISDLLGHYRSEIEAGKSFEEALKLPLSIILASPGFLYLREPTEGQTKRTLSDAELAVRLSYFLWSSPPDAQLLKAAADGTLQKAGGLIRETNRLLLDPKGMEFISGFTHQWLHMERLDFFQYNFRLYPGFDDSTKMASRQEVYQSLLRLIRRNLPIGELLKSDTVVINELLAQHYDIPRVNGQQFREVKVPDGLPRGGLLGMAAVLAMGSDGERTSPVERGAWVMRKLLHNPPPPAPANVPQLSRHAGKLLSAREMLEAHMEEAQCAQCHRKIDPIGFGLENFDAVGKWRDAEYTEIARNNNVSKSKEHPIDSSGTLPDGTKFSGFYELRDAIAQQEAAFARGFVEHLIEYALGRPYGFSDAQLADQILEQGKKAGGSPGHYIHALVMRPVFRTK